MPLARALPADAGARRRDARAAEAVPPDRAVWWVRSLRQDPAGDASTVVVHGVATDERPDGAVVDVGGLPAGAAVAAGRVARITVHAGTQRLLAVEVLGAHAAAAPRLVLVERASADGGRPAAELAAFRHEHVAARAAALRAYVAAGAVVTAADAARLGLRPADRVGALRWCPASGRVLDVDVAPARRRDGVAVLLLLAAQGAAAARGWPRPPGVGAPAAADAVLARLRHRVGRLGGRPRTPPPADGVPAPRRVGVRVG